MPTARTIALCFALSMLPLAGCDRAPDAAPETANANAKAANPALGAHWQYPRERVIGGRKVIVHAPQIRSWEQYQRFTAQVAVEFLEPDASARYAVLDLSGDTELDRTTRLVKAPKPKVDRVTFSGGEGTAEHEQRIRTVVEGEPLELPLDVFLYYLADGESGRRTRRHHDIQAGRDRSTRREAAAPRDCGHRRARVDREHGEPVVPVERQLLPACVGTLVLDQGSRERAMEVHDAAARSLCAHSGR